ncbi:MAG: hypothetical protein ACOY4R_12590 [Pseudomonadota bacterium]
MVFFADDDSTDLDAIVLRQRAERIDDQRTAGGRIPLHEEQFGRKAGPLELAGKEAGSPFDTQFEIIGVAVVSKVRHERNVWCDGVHVELL